MYAFVTLFGLLALLTQLRAIRNPSMRNWALYILATAALLWSHYFGLLLIGVQQVIFVGVLIHRHGARASRSEPLALGFAYSLAVLVMQLVPLVVFAHNQFQLDAPPRPARRAGPTTRCPSTRSSPTWPGRSGATTPTRSTELLAAMWPLLLLLLAAPARSRRLAPDQLILAVAAFIPDRAALIGVSRCSIASCSRCATS